MFNIWVIVFQLVLSLIAIMLAPKPKSNARPATLEEYTVNTASADRVYPLLYGTYKVNGANVCWYGDFSSEEIKQKVKSGLFGSKKVGTGQFRYWLGFKFSIGYGGTRLLEIKTDEYTLHKDHNNSGSFSGRIDKPGVYGKNDNVIGNFTFYDGSQEISDPYLKEEILKNVDSNYTLNDIPSWHGLSYFSWKGGEVGTSRSLRSWSFICERVFTPSVFQQMGGSAYTTIYDATYDYNSMNPAYIIYDILTNQEYGCGQLDEDIDLYSFLDVAKICYDEGWGLSVYKDQYGSARELINEIVKYPNLAFFLDKRTNKFVLKAIRDDYNFEDLPIFDESNILQVVAYNVGSSDNKLNEVKIRWTSYENFNQKINQFQNEGVRFEKSSVDSTTVDYLYLNNSEKAQLAAQREAMPLTTDLSQLTIDVSFELTTSINLKKGDVFRFSFEPYGIADKVFRVSTVEFSEGGKRAARITAMQDTFGLSHTSLTTPPDSSFRPPDTTLTAMQMYVETAPRFLAQEEHKVMTYGLKPKGFMTNYDILINNQFDSTAGGFTPRGVIVEDIDKETTNIVVDSTFADFTEYTLADMMDGGNYAMIVDYETGTREIISFKNAVFENGYYTLKDCFRGCSDTLPKDFSGDNLVVWLLHYGSGDNDSIDVFPDNTYIFKALTKTETDTLDPSIAPEISYDVTNRRNLPIVPAGLKVNGDYFGQTIIADSVLKLDWYIRNINNQNKIKPYTLDDETILETGSEYILNVYDASDDSLLINYTGRDTSFEYTDEDPLARVQEYRIELYTKNGTLESLEKYDFNVSRV